MSDPTGNWGGIYHERFRHQEEFEPHLTPETIHYSYINAFSWPHFSDWEWNRLLKVEGTSAGIAVCQLHGRRAADFGTSEPSILDFEGGVLRLRLDGSVVQKMIYWETTSGGFKPGKRGNSWRFFSDAPPPLP
jgi:hypothetical protein